MFSPEEQRKIQAVSLHQWQAEQRALRESKPPTIFYDWMGVCFATDGESVWPVVDQLFCAPGDVRFLKQLHISPA